MEGDERAMRALWERHAPAVDAVVRRLAGDDDLAADIAQDVWIQIFRALPGFRGDSQFSTWAHRIAVNRTLNALRKVRREQRQELPMDNDTVAIEPHNTDRILLAESIDGALKELAPGARQVFVLHDVEGYTHEQIAEELGISTGGSKSQLFKSRAKLRRLLSHLVEVRSESREESHAAPAR